MEIDGVLVVNKPAGMTSHDVVLKVRRWLNIRRVGHTGTLDPAAEGVLPLCLGKATKLVEYIQAQPKTYIAEWTAGIATDTGDRTGKIIARSESVRLNGEEVGEAFASFVGKYSQVPPMYSAVKVGGVRLHELAREGKEVERPAREVEIYELEILTMDLSPPYPRVKFRVCCSKGTYIRTLCADIGQKLGVPAHMSALLRTESGGFGIDEAVTLEEMEQAVYAGDWQRLIRPLEEALPFMPKWKVPPFLVSRILHGQPIRPRIPLPDLGQGELVQLLSPEGKLLAIHKVVKKGDLWSKPEKILHTPE